MSEDFESRNAPNISEAQESRHCYQNRSQLLVNPMAVVPFDTLHGYVLTVLTKSLSLAAARWFSGAEKEGGNTRSFTVMWK